MTPAARPLVVAHRSSPLDAGTTAAENSVGGVRLAAALGADLVEVDVRRCLDGVPLLMHDRTGWRTARWPLPLRLTRSRWLRGRRLRGSGDAVPAFADALAALPAGTGVAVDLKDPGALAAAVDVLRAAGRLGDALLWCRDVRRVREAVDLAPGVPTALLRNTFDRAATMRYVGDAAAAGAGAVSLHERAVDAEAVGAAHDAGLTVFAWALAPASHHRFLQAGVDGIVTDWPRLAREAVAALGAGGGPPQPQADEAP